MPGFVISEAVWPADKAIVQTLFQEYAASLGVDLCFQNFEDELATLPGKYARPAGAVFLARRNDKVAAVGCYRPLADGCEMKRLYVRSDCRGHGLGRAMAEALIRDAGASGHAFMVLDSLESMGTAQALYRSLGFRDIEAYYANPLPGTTYMRLDFNVSGKALA